MEDRDQKTNNSEAPLKKLASAQDLRGSKSGSGKEGNGKRRNLWLSLIVLVVVLVAAVGVYTASKLIKPEEEIVEDTTPSTESSIVKIVNRDRSEVASVTIDLADAEPYTILNNNEYDAEGKALDLPEGEVAYTIEGLDDFILNQTSGYEIIGYAANLTASKLVTDNAENLADFGLDAPLSEITMNYRDGSSTTWLVGSHPPTSTYSYFAEKGSKAVFLLYNSAISTLCSSRNSLHVVEMPWTFDPEAVNDIIIETEGRDTVEVGYIEDDGLNVSMSRVHILQPFDYTANLDRTNEMFTGISELTINGFAGELDELEGTGLEDGAARIKVTVKVMQLDSSFETYVYRIGNFASPSQVYIQIDDTNAVYLASAVAASFLDNATPGYLVDQFANLVYINYVDAVDIVTDDDSWNIRIEREEVEGKTKPVESFYFDGEPTDEALCRKLYQDIIGTMNNKLSDKYDIDGKVYCTVTYTLNTEPNSFVIEYIEYDNDYLALRRDGGVTLFLIKRENVDALLTKLQEYRDGTYVAVY